MSVRIGLFALALAGPLALAVGQQTGPAKLEDSSPTAKADSQSSRRHVRLGGVFIGTGYSRYSGYPSYGYYSGFWGRRPDFFDPFLLWPFAPGFATGFVYQPNMGEVKSRRAIRPHGSTSMARLLDGPTTSGVCGSIPA